MSQERSEQTRKLNMLAPFFYGLFVRCLHGGPFVADGEEEGRKKVSHVTVLNLVLFIFVMGGREKESHV
jgi:hypothetical protein